MSTKKPAAKAAAKKPEPKHPAPVAARPPENLIPVGAVVETGRGASPEAAAKASDLAAELLRDPNFTYPPREA